MDTFTILGSTVTFEYAPRAPTPHPTPAYYHVTYRGNGESQMRWHGETYCLVGGYRAYGDAPIATPAKAKEEEPAPRQASKRRRAQEESHRDGGCPSPRIPRLRRGSKRRAQRSLLVGHLCGEDKPRAAETAQAPSALTTAPLGHDLSSPA
uniref:DPEP2 neighbor protein n=1 Tax=Jaculus jaculus TaxID=51337 RepID=UPI001E1AFD98|nr:DPEP2 neighbor protein [Jaculus jaculus]